MTDHNFTAKISTELDPSSLDKMREQFQKELEKAATAANKQMEKDEEKAKRKEEQQAKRDQTEVQKQLDWEERERKKALKDLEKVVKDQYKKMNEDMKKGIPNELEEFISPEERDREKSNALGEQKKEVKSQTDLFKNWRKTLTGILIDLHWMRILASQSRIVSINMELMGRSLGYLLDMALLPMLPSIVALSQAIIGSAMWISKLPAPVRVAIATIMSLIVSLFTMMTAVALAFALYAKLNTQMGIFSKLLTKVNLQLSKVGGGKAGGSTSLTLGAELGLTVVYLMYMTGVLGRIYEVGQATRKWLDKNVGNIGIKFSQLLNLIAVLIIKFLEFITPIEAIKAITETASFVYDIGKLIWDYLMSTLGNVVELGAKILDAIITWVKDSLANVIDAGAKILTIFIEWVKSGFQDPVGFVTKILDVIIEMIKAQLSISTNLAADVTTAVVEFVKSNLGALKDLVLGTKERTEGFDFRDIGNIVPMFALFKRMGIPTFATGGTMPYDGLAYLHKNETITPEGNTNNAITINLNVNGAMDNRTIDEVIRKLKIELGRVRG